jgi:hypothetical protein
MKKNFKILVVLSLLSILFVQCKVKRELRQHINEDIERYKSHAVVSLDLVSSDTVECNLFSKSYNCVNKK